VPLALLCVLALWGLAVHFRYCRDSLSLRGYLAFRCGWFLPLSEIEIERRLQGCVDRNDFRLGLLILDWYSQCAPEPITPEERAMAGFFAGCCAYQLGDIPEALLLWNRIMTRFPDTRGALWARRAIQWVCHERERSWIV